MSPHHVSDDTIEPAQAIPTSATLSSDVRILHYQVQQLDKKLDKFFDEVKNSYASKSDLASVKEDVQDLKSNISWAIKIVVGAVLIGLLGLVIAKGGGGFH